MTPEQIQLLKRIYRRLTPSLMVNAVYISPAQQLRNQANELEANERDNIQFKELIDSLEYE